ncbi:MAG: hypothetical protein RLZZ502_7 [Pseudomonadota bacterium]
MDYQLLFEHAPAALWLEDFTEVKAYFARKRAEGVEDLLAYFQSHPGEIEICARAIKLVAVNKQTLILVKARDINEINANIDRIFGTEMKKTLMHDMNKLWQGATHYVSDNMVNYALDGTPIEVQLRCQILPGSEESWAEVLYSTEDISQRVSAEKARYEAERYAKGLFVYSPVAIMVQDFSHIKGLMDDVRQQGIEDFRTFLNVHPEFVEECMRQIRIVEVNQQTLTLYGVGNKSEFIANMPRLFRGEMSASFAETLTDLWNGKHFIQREVLNYHLSGDVINGLLQFNFMPGHEQKWDLAAVSITDITARKKAEKYLEYLGKHDTLTKIRNRAYYDDELVRVQRSGPFPVGIMLLDLNGLKEVNDEYGHTIGDAMLRRMGEVLKKVFDEKDCVARIGGDEFIVLLPGKSVDDLVRYKDQLDNVTKLNNQFYLGKALSYACGLAVCEKDELLPKAISRADKAMYTDKREMKV